MYLFFRFFRNPINFLLLSFSTSDLRSRARQTTMVETRSASATPTHKTRLQNASPKVINYADIHKHGFYVNDSEKPVAKPVPFASPSPFGKRSTRSAHNNKKKKAKKTTANGGNEEEKEEEASLRTIEETQMEGEGESEKEEEERGGGGERDVVSDSEEEKEKEKERTVTVDVGEPSDATPQHKTRTTTASTGKETNELSKAPSSFPLSPDSKQKETRLRWKDYYKEYFYNAVVDEYLEEDGLGEYMLKEDFCNGKVTDNEFKRMIAAHVMKRVVTRLAKLTSEPKKGEEDDESKKKTRHERDQLEAYVQLAWDPTDEARAYRIKLYNDFDTDEKEAQILRFTRGLKGKKKSDSDGIFGEESYQEVKLNQKHTTGTTTEDTSYQAKVIRAIHPFLKNKSWTCNRPDILADRRQGTGWPKKWHESEAKKKEARDAKEKADYSRNQQRKKATFKANFKSSEKPITKDERHEERRPNEADNDVEKEEGSDEYVQTAAELLEEENRKRKQLKRDRKSSASGNTFRGNVAKEDDYDEKMKEIQEQQNEYAKKEAARQDALLQIRREELALQKQHVELQMEALKQQSQHFELKQAERAARVEEDRLKFVAQLDMMKNNK